MYTLTAEKDYFVISSGSTGAHSVLCDTVPWEHFGEDSLEDHFGDIHALFLDRITALQNPLHILLPQEEKELQFMLEALMQTKRTLQDRP